MIDVHCHLNFHSFKDDYDAVIKDALKNSVDTIINVGTKIDSSAEAVDLAHRYDNLYAIVGVHPHHADKLEEGWEDVLRKLGKEKKVLAVGEIGLDYFRYKSNGIVDPKLQKDVFEKQIMIAHELKKPLQIHNRHAANDTIEILQHHKNYLQTDIPGMFHCFAGDTNFLKKALEMGFYIGFDGNITYDGLAPGETTRLPDLVTFAPLDRIVTETDSPFLTPIPHRGMRNKPEYVILVAQEIAKIKGLSFEDVKNQTVTNAKRLFGL